MRIPGEESQSPRPRTRGRSAGTDQLDWVYREQDYAAFTTTIHPDVAGRPQVLMALERVIAHIKGHDGVRWVTFGEIAQDFLRRSPRPA